MPSTLSAHTGAAAGARTVSSPGRPQVALPLSVFPFVTASVFGATAENLNHFRNTGGEKGLGKGDRCEDVDMSLTCADSNDLN